MHTSVVTWLTCVLQALGYVPLPSTVLLPDSGSLAFTAMLVDNAIVHTGSGENRPSVLVYTAQLWQQMKRAASSSAAIYSKAEVVVKVPGTDQLFDNEVSYVRLKVKQVWGLQNWLLMQHMHAYQVGSLL